MNKKIILLAAVMAAASVFSACGSKDDSEDDRSKSDVVTTRGVVTTTAPAENGVVTTTGPNGETNATTTTGKATTTKAETKAPKYTTTATSMDENGLVLTETEDVDINALVFDENDVKVTVNKYETILDDMTQTTLCPTFEVSVENNSDTVCEIHWRNVRFNEAYAEDKFADSLLIRSNKSENDKFYMSGATVVSWTGFNLNDIEIIDFDLEVGVMAHPFVADKILHCQLNRTTGDFTYKEITKEEEE